MIGSANFHEISVHSKHHQWHGVPNLQETRLSVGNVSTFLYTLSVVVFRGKLPGTLKNSVNGAIHGLLVCKGTIGIGASAQRLQLDKARLTKEEPQLCGILNFIKINKHNESTCHWSR